MIVSFVTAATTREYHRQAIVLAVLRWPGLRPGCTATVLALVHVISRLVKSAQDDRSSPALDTELPEPRGLRAVPLASGLWETCSANPASGRDEGDRLPPPLVPFVNGVVLTAPDVDDETPRRGSAEEKPCIMSWSRLNSRPPSGAVGITTSNSMSGVQ